MAESKVHTVAEFNEIFEKLFAEADANHNGGLEIEEARHFFTAVSAHRPDSEALDEQKFVELFAQGAVDGRLPKEFAH